MRACFSVLCQNVYPFNQIHKEKEEGIAYLCHVGKWIP